MNLRDRLRDMGGGGAAKKQPSEPVSADCGYRKTVYPLSQFADAAEMPGDMLRLMWSGRLPEIIKAKSILYLDTETTGLGGSGTVAFLVGLGFLTEDGFEVHQFLMRDYPEEPHLLKHVAGALEKFDLLCTFNGMGFDVPLLQSRFLMNRMSAARLEEMPHIDLLCLSRRLWRLRLKHCNLTNLEDKILGAPREDDLPGSEAPARYFAFLRTGRQELLEDVITHNARDVAGLCSLLTRMAGMYAHPEKIRFSEDVYSMGRALERTACTEQARECYRLASKGRMGDRASEALAVSYRRCGSADEAAKVWREMIRRRLGGVQPYIELAKYQEHTLLDCRAALETTEAAMAALADVSLSGMAGGGDAVQKMKSELQYRRARLKRRLKES